MNTVLVPNERVLDVIEFCKEYFIIPLPAKNSFTKRCQKMMLLSDGRRLFMISFIVIKRITDMPG